MQINAAAREEQKERTRRALLLEVKQPNKTHRDRFLLQLGPWWTRYSGLVVDFPCSRACSLLTLVAIIIVHRPTVMRGFVSNCALIIGLGRGKDQAFERAALQLELTSRNAAPDQMY